MTGGNRLAEVLAVLAGLAVLWLVLSVWLGFTLGTKIDPTTDDFEDWP